jgi:hypothetical protein
MMHTLEKKDLAKDKRNGIRLSSPGPNIKLGRSTQVCNPFLPFALRTLISTCALNSLSASSYYIIVRNKNHK